MLAFETLLIFVLTVCLSVRVVKASASLAPQRIKMKNTARRNAQNYAGR